MKNKRNGFTLVEIIVAVILLAVIGTIIIFSVTNLVSKTQEDNYDSFKQTVISSAEEYAQKDEAVYNDLYMDKSYVYITVGDLINAGIIDSDLTNPMTGETIGKNETVKISLDEDGNLSYTYPIEENEDETSLVKINQWVANGEPFNCMEGAGSYNLALSDETGTLIDLSNSDNISKYQFKCSMSSNEWTHIVPTAANAEKNKTYFINNFTNGIVDDENVVIDDTTHYVYIKNCNTDECNAINNDLETMQNGNYYVLTKYYDNKTVLDDDADKLAGNYEVTYEWVTETGIRKQKNAKVVVKKKAIGGLKFYSKTGDSANSITALNSDDAFNYQPVFKDGTWTYLIAGVTVENADIANTQYWVIKHAEYNSTTVGNYIDSGSTAYNTKGVSVSNNRKQYYDVNNGNKSIDDNKIKGLVDSYYNVTSDKQNNLFDGAEASSDFDDTFIVDDGKFVYYIKVETKGHFLQTYTYSSIDLYETSVKLYVPDDFIKVYEEDNTSSLVVADGAAETGTGYTKTWTLSNNIYVYTPYSTVGILGYNIYFNDSSNAYKSVFDATDAHAKSGDASGQAMEKRASFLTANKNDNYFSSSNYSLINYKLTVENTDGNKCNTKVYSSVKLVPVNNNGYYDLSSLSSVKGVTTKITNRFSLLIATDTNATKCEKGCTAVSSSSMSSDKYKYIVDTENDSDSGNYSIDSAVDQYKLDNGGSAQVDSTANLNNSFILKGLSCYYCGTKSDPTSVYFTTSDYTAYNNSVSNDEDKIIFKVLGIFKNGYDVYTNNTFNTSSLWETTDGSKWDYLVTPVYRIYDSTHLNKKYSLNSYNTKVWSITTCDGTYTASYSFASPTFRQNALIFTKNYVRQILNFDQDNTNGFVSNLATVQCKANVGVDYSAEMESKVPSIKFVSGSVYYSWMSQAQREEAAAQKKAYEEFYNALKYASNLFRYDSTACVVSRNDLDIFGKGLFDTTFDNYQYWLATTMLTTATARVSHGDTLNYYSTYYEKRIRDGYTNSIKYVGTEAYLSLRVMLKVQNVDCVYSGDGSFNTPYIADMNA